MGDKKYMLVGRALDPAALQTFPAEAKFSLERMSGWRTASPTKLIEDQVFQGFTDEQLGADQVVQILSDCILQSGGNGKEVELSNVLQWYGFDDQAQIDVLKTRIIGISDYGVAKYGFHLAGDDLNFATPDTLLSELADTIQIKATPTSDKLSLSLMNSIGPLCPVGPHLDPGLADAVPRACRISKVARVALQCSQGHWAAYPCE